MRQTIIDLYISNNPYEGEEEKIEYNSTFTDFPKKGAWISTSREGALTAALNEIDELFKANVSFVRMFDTYSMKYYDFYKT